MRILRKNYFRASLYFLILITIIICLTYFYSKQEEQKLLNSKYSSYTKNIESSIKTLIDMKKNASLLIAISLANDERLVPFLKNKEKLEIDYKKISDDLKDSTKFKNVWIQVIDINGNSLYRSWTDLKSDLSFRKDLKQTLIDKKASASISVGLFDLTIKGRSPIYLNNDVIGFIEVITHFNSITDMLKENDINSVVIADKKYKNTIIYPFSNSFMKDYYISTKINPIIEKEILNSENIDEYTNLNEFTIKNNYLIYTYKLSNNFDSNLGYILNFVNLENIDISNIKSFKSQIFTNTIILMIVLVLIFITYIYLIESSNNKKFNTKLKRHIKQLNNIQKYKQSILDSQASIIVITNGTTILNCNKRLFEFFQDVKNLVEFRKKYTCICTSFLDMGNELYIVDKKYNNDLNWAQYIVANPDKNFKVAMIDSEKNIKHFSIDASKIKDNNNLIITLTDITYEIEQMKINKEKDRLLFQQSKISAISDTLKNIAHHWRQPLSIISTIASGMKIEKELGILDDKRFGILCEDIIKNTNKLSTTIDNFSDFLTKDNSSTSFEMIETIQGIENFLTTIFEKNEIKCILKYDNNKILNCNKTDFSQAILNILDNSIYALIHKKNSQENIILIEFENEILSISDSGDGIDETILQKVFEPYFTTKHQSYGIGLGLYTVQDLFVNNLGYKIAITNNQFNLENKNFTGTNISINFN